MTKFPNISITPRDTGPGRGEDVPNQKTDSYGFPEHRRNFHRLISCGSIAILLLSLTACSSAPAPRSESISQDESLTPADVGAMLTGSWYVENENRRGMATLGGLLSYDMTTSKTLNGRKIGEERVTAGPLWIAGKTNSRALSSEGENSSGHWFFPFWRYQEKNGKRTLYPLMVIPIPMGSSPIDDNRYLASDDDDWSVDEYPVSDEYSESIVKAKPISEQITSQEPVLMTPETVRPTWQALDIHEKTYKVRKGDTLWSLAIKFYGDGQRYRDLIAANGRSLANPSQIPVGSTLVIPN